MPSLARVYGTFTSHVGLADTRTAILATSQVLGWKLKYQNETVMEFRPPRYPWVDGKMEIYPVATSSGTTLSVKMSAGKLSNYNRKLDELMSSFLGGLSSQLDGALPHEAPPPPPPG